MQKPLLILNSYDNNNDNNNKSVRWSSSVAHNNIINRVIISDFCYWNKNGGMCSDDQVKHTKLWHFILQVILKFVLNQCLCQRVTRRRRIQIIISHKIKFKRTKQDSLDSRYYETYSYLNIILFWLPYYVYNLCLLCFIEHRQIKINVKYFLGAPRETST